MILVYGLTGLAFAFVLMWRFWPDPEAAQPGDIKESDLSLSESIDRAIALAAALPEENETLDTPEAVAAMAERYLRQRVWLTPRGAETASDL